jgi:hypothetical protein
LLPAIVLADLLDIQFRHIVLEPDCHYEFNPLILLQYAHGLLLFETLQGPLPFLGLSGPCLSRYTSENVAPALFQPSAKLENKLVLDLFVPGNIVQFVDCSLELTFSYLRNMQVSVGSSRTHLYLIATRLWKLNRALEPPNLSWTI